MYVSELTQYVNRKCRYSTALNQVKGYPVHIVGTVPLALKDSRWNTEEEGKQALIALGVPFFQLLNCSWYPYKPTSKEDQEKIDAFWN